MLDNHMDDGLDLPCEDELSHEYVQGYHILDPILRDPRSYTYACNNILDKNTTKMQELIVWAYKCSAYQKICLHLFLTKTRVIRCYHITFYSISKRS